MSSEKFGGSPAPPRRKRHDLPEHLLGEKRGAVRRRDAPCSAWSVPGLDVHVHVRERVRRDERDGVVVRRALVAAGRSARQVRNHDERDDRDQRDGARGNGTAEPPLRRDRAPSAERLPSLERAAQEVEEIAKK